MIFASELIIQGIDEVLKINRNINSDNANRKVDGRTEARIIEIACGPVPKGHSRWTIRLLEDYMKVELEEPISREAIRRTLKKTGLDLTAVTTGISQAK
jgi:transposase